MIVVIVDLLKLPQLLHAYCVHDGKMFADVMYLTA